MIERELLIPLCCESLKKLYIHLWSHFSSNVLKNKLQISFRLIWMGETFSKMISNDHHYDIWIFATSSIRMFKASNCLVVWMHEHGRRKYSYHQIYTNATSPFVSTSCLPCQEFLKRMRKAAYFGFGGIQACPLLENIKGKLHFTPLWFSVFSHNPPIVSKVIHNPLMVWIKVSK